MNRNIKPSGLGLGSDGKFADVLSEIESASGAPVSTSKSGGSFQPLGGLQFTKSQKRTEDDWPKELADVKAFPANLAERFECPKGWGWGEAKENRLHIKPLNRDPSRWMKVTEFGFLPTSAASLRTSITSAPREARVGFAVDGLRVGLRSQKNAVVVFLRNRGKDAGENVLHTLKTSSPVRLAVYRKPDQPKKLHWIIGELKEDGKFFGGEITVNDFPEKPSLTWFLTAAKKKPPKPFWIAKLMLRE